MVKRRLRKRWWTLGVLFLGLGAVGFSLFLNLRRVERSARSFSVKGIDVSHHQGSIDWEQLTQDSVDFALIKATEGVQHLDTRFQENWSKASLEGLVWGPYHFLTFCSPGRPQAEHFIRHLPTEQSMLPPVVDVEFGGNCRKPPPDARIREELESFLETVEESTGRRPVIYVNQESYSRIVGGHFSTYPLWIRSVFQPPRAEWGVGRNWMFWQYSATGEKKGIDGPVDLNAFNGNREELERLVR